MSKNNGKRKRGRPRDYLKIDLDPEEAVRRLLAPKKKPQKGTREDEKLKATRELGAEGD